MTTGKAHPPPAAAERVPLAWCVGLFGEAEAALQDAKAAYLKGGLLSKNEDNLAMRDLYKLRHATPKDLALSGVADSLNHVSLVLPGDASVLRCRSCS